MARPRFSDGGFRAEADDAYLEVSRYRVAALKAELADLMDLAEHGELLYGRDEDVEKMQYGQGWVLELRHQCPTGGRIRHVRMYFTEPAHEQGVLLGLHLTVKLENDGTRDWKAAQNRDCAEAEVRIKEHYDLVTRPIDAV